MSDTPGLASFTQLVDLAAVRLGGMALAANDEYFAAKENLLLERPPTFDPHRYTDRGKLMDGWETRRRRETGHDWCVVRLGVPGIVRGVVVDTSFFRGNYPDRCSLHGCVADGALTADDLTNAEWFPLLGETALEGDARNAFSVEASARVTHLRLAIFPDGGVARLRVHGEPLADLRRSAGAGGRLDLAAVVNGGTVPVCSDMFFSSGHNLVTVGDGRNMGDGWETRRRRGPGHDWAIVRLATQGVVERVEVDTTNFKGNYPDSCFLEACDAGNATVPPGNAEWWQLLAPAKLGPHARHVFDVDQAHPATHVRLNILPDGGVARLRLHGSISETGWQSAGVRWLNALPDRLFADEVRTCCASTAWAARLAETRPLGDFDALLAAADQAWEATGPEDWQQAFAAHPRIGAPAGVASARGTADHPQGQRWAQQEQAGTQEAATDILAALAEGNRAYEQRFGQTFLICAAGRSADEMLAELRARMGNEPETELRVAAEEQRKITRLRLAKLMLPSTVT